MNIFSFQWVPKQKEWLFDVSLLSYAGLIESHVSFLRVCTFGVRLMHGTDKSRFSEFIFLWLFQKVYAVATFPVPVSYFL